jgi:hypothetical protein
MDSLFNVGSTRPQQNSWCFAMLEWEAKVKAILVAIGLAFMLAAAISPASAQGQTTTFVRWIPKTKPKPPPVPKGPLIKDNRVNIDGQINVYPAPERSEPSRRAPTRPPPPEDDDDDDDDDD